ncbi:DNA internalization-related competence protein ComEC/Rec2 [Legionella taurinensis]|uniref:DNA internalization-related competence protein ComEC/Rec2 n=1 Tax=Legionella taurinensis TaxID=70611 RepID=UPI0010AB1AEE|nr:DNA internalization-related competence protein ComEC/Rec2 [Legionella taurinensis]MDX1838829.1 DNA internalization-related competence protein ComEC/Rec2 [Legionella taurinensis]
MLNLPGMSQVQFSLMGILCFFAGIAFFYSQSLYALVVVFFGLLFKAGWGILVWFLAACLWSWLHQHAIAEKNMPLTPVIQQALIKGTVVSIPAVHTDKTQFQLALTAINGQPAKALMLLNCYQRCPEVHAGQGWQFHAKLKRPINLRNPGAFDYRRWLTARHVTWTGYLKPGQSLLIKEAPADKLLVWRERLAANLTRSIPKGEELGIVQALTLGVTHQMGSESWDLFRRTGTTHLMVISGAHIGLVAGFCMGITQWLWRRWGRLCLFCPSQQAGSLAGMLAAFSYALLAGFGVPAQRSLVGTVLLLSRYWLSRQFTVWQAWRYGLFLVLLYEPHAVLLPGFYLSFMAVAVLIITHRRYGLTGIKQTLALQLACLAGLMPVTLYCFGYGAINGLLANLLAIPLVSFVLVPLSLISLIISNVVSSSWLMMPVIGTTKLLLLYLRWIDSFAMVNLQVGIQEISTVVILLLVLGLLLVLPLKLIWPALFCMLLAVWVPKPSRLERGEARIDVLDVGQGLAIVVSTREHYLIYDTGMKFFHGSDMGKLAVIPYLQAMGIPRIDKIIISHPDLDHRGGLESIEEQYPDAELLVDRVDFYHRGQTCHHYPDWEWDGIQFHFFPVLQQFNDKNNSSCILQISRKGQHVLLTGDIEKKGEDYLVQRYSGRLQAAVLVVAHHGSKTSSSPAFINQVKPRFAIISAGFDNRYHFPHAQTLTTLEQAGSQVLNTMACGMVRLSLQKGKGLEPVCWEREAG